MKAYSRMANDNNVPQLFIVSNGCTIDCNIPGVCIFETKNRTKEEIAGLYQNAFGFIFPSLHEGFGVPIIEAMACGIPVLTSKTTSCAETAGGAALLVDPKSISQIEEGMIRLVMDAKYKEELTKKGLERVRDFSWEKCAQEHLAIFKKVCNG